MMTQYKNPLFKGPFSRSQKFNFPIITKEIENLREEVNFSTKVKASEFIQVLFPTRPFVQKFHCIYCIELKNSRPSAKMND